MLALKLPRYTLEMMKLLHGYDDKFNKIVKLCSRLSTARG